MWDRGRVALSGCGDTICVNSITSVFQEPDGHTVDVVGTHTSKEYLMCMENNASIVSAAWFTMILSHNTSLRVIMVITFTMFDVLTELTWK